MAPRDGFEPPTDRLTADCSTAELPRSSLYDEACNSEGETKMQASSFFIENGLPLRAVAGR